MKKILSLSLVIVILSAICIFVHANETQQDVISSEAIWWEWFNSLSPEDQSRINFRPSRDTGVANEEYPVETEKVDKNEFE